MTERCQRDEHDLTVTCDDDYAAECSKCGLKLPCDDCAWASACCMVVGECCKYLNERDGIKPKPFEPDPSAVFGGPVGVMSIRGDDTWCWVEERFGHYHPEAPGGYFYHPWLSRILTAPTWKPLARSDDIHDQAK